MCHTDEQMCHTNGLANLDKFPPKHKHRQSAKTSLVSEFCLFSSGATGATTATMLT